MKACVSILQVSCDVLIENVSQWALRGILYQNARTRKENKCVTEDEKSGKEWLNSKVFVFDRVSAKDWEGAMESDK